MLRLLQPEMGNQALIGSVACQCIGARLRQKVWILCHARLRASLDVGFQVVIAGSNVHVSDNPAQLRIEKGGHDIPEDIIRRRHEGSLRMLSSALRYADEALLIDNSGIEPREIFRVCAGVIVGSNLDRRNPLHRLFEGRVMEAYDVVRVGETYRLSAIE